MVEANPAASESAHAGKVGKAGKKGGKKLRVSTAECAVEKPLLREVIQANGYVEVENVRQAADITFLHPMAEGANQRRALTEKGIFNRLPGVRAAKNKRQCAIVFERMHELYGADYDFTPRSYVLPQDRDKLQKAMSKGTQTYILKPQESEQGQGIMLVQRFSDIPTFVFNQDYVAQLYIADPLLIDRKKFDLRIYVLVSQIGSYPVTPTIAFVAGEGMVRLCTVDYEQPSVQNMHNLLQHLTNSSLNKLSSDFVTSENLEESSTRPLSVALQQLTEQGIDPEQIQSSIASVCAKSLIAMQPYMLFEQERILSMVGTGASNTASAKLKGDCFQILGFDILIDSQLKAWVLEINENPAMDITLKRNLPSGEVVKTVGHASRFIQLNVVQSAIWLMTRHKRKVRPFVTQEGCFKKLLPAENELEFMVDSKAKFLYELLLGGRKGLPMTMTGFSKLAKAFQGLQRVRIELLYRKVVSSGNMDLFSFFVALKLLAESEVQCEYSYLVDHALAHFAPDSAATYDRAIEQSNQ